MSEMKSAYELAMERLGGESKSLSEEKKELIADIDCKMKAKIAELEIMFKQQISTESDPAKAAFQEQTLKEQIAKIEADTESEKERVRNS